MEKQLKQLLAAMSLQNRLEKEKEISVFEVKIIMSETSLKAGVSSCNDVQDLLGEEYDEWFDEASSQICPLVSDQTRKLNNIMNDFFGRHTDSVDISPIPTSEDIRQGRKKGKEDEQRRNGGASSEQDAGA